MVRIVILAIALALSATSVGAATVHIATPTLNLTVAQAKTGVDKIDKLVAWSNCTQPKAPPCTDGFDKSNRIVFEVVGSSRVQSILVEWNIADITTNESTTDLNETFAFTTRFGGSIATTDVQSFFGEFSQDQKTIRGSTVIDGKKLSVELTPTLIGVELSPN